METRYHIGLLTGTLLILAILSYAYYADYNYRKEIARTEETLDKIQNRIDRRKKIMEDIENKYQNQGVELPENIQTQYDNTKVKRQELEEIYEGKLRELEGLKQMVKMS